MKQKVKDKCGDVLYKLTSTYNITLMFLNLAADKETEVASTGHWKQAR